MPRPAEPRRVPRPTVRGLILAAAGIVALVLAGLLQHADLLLVGLILLLAVLGAHLALLRPGPQPLVLRTIRPDAVNAGETAAVTVTVRSPDGRPLPRRRWRDTVPAGVVAGRIAVAVEPDGALVLSYPIRADRRGVHPIGPLRVRRRDPLGLALVPTGVGPVDTLLVLPRVTPLEDSSLDDAAAGEADLVAMHRSAPSVDEVSARDYERGDPVRRVNWRASAKRGRLMVRQEERRSEPRAWLLLDTVAAGEHDGAGFERAVELAASIGVHLVEHGVAVGIVETGTAQLDDPVFAAPDGARLIPARLAAIAPAPDAEAAIDGFAEALRRSGEGTPAFAILAEGTAETGRRLAGVRGYAGAAIAFLLTPGTAAARPELEAAGWTCVTVVPEQDLAAAWAAAGSAGNGAGRA